jgi:hypothetical protein
LFSAATLSISKRRAVSEPAVTPAQDSESDVEELAGDVPVAWSDAVPAASCDPHGLDPTQPLDLFHREPAVVD